MVKSFQIGEINLKLINTPGHTLESSCYLLEDNKEKAQCLFTGDTLFIGDVGRPDLAVKHGELTEVDLAKHLFHSLRDKIMVLPDDVIIYPNHGAGSACGKNMSKETYDTLGHQKEVNYALNSKMTEAQFVKELLTGLTPPPQYFSKNVMMNKGINDGIDTIINRGTKALSVEEFVSLQVEGVLLLDVRPQAEFIENHIPGSIFIGLNGQFAPWVGALIIDIDQRIALIVPEGKEEEAVTRLSRIGYDNSIGYLNGGISAWKENGQSVDSIKKISASEFEESYNNDPEINVLDVRKTTEFSSIHLTNAVNEPLSLINSRIGELDKDKTYYVHCAGGYRSVIFESIAKANGIHNLIDIGGGFSSIQEETQLKKTDFVCPSEIV